MDFIENTHGRLDLLVNNAGSVVATHAASTSDEDARDQFDQLFGAVRVVRLATRVMRHGRKRRVARDPKKKGRDFDFVAGRIVNVGSIGGRIGLPFQSMYSASKAATMTWSDALRLELASEAIFVSLIEPGDLKPGMVNARKAEGFDADPVAKRATDIMRVEEAIGTDPRVGRRWLSASRKRQAQRALPGRTGRVAGGGARPTRPARPGRSTSSRRTYPSAAAENAWIGCDRASARVGGGRRRTEKDGRRGEYL